jgi:uncharacterized protein YecE (DUF72 family)
VATIRVGTAGWGIPAAHRERFGSTGGALERYAKTFNCVEINSTFYRSHRAATYERWAASVPDDFAFTVKVPKAITHVKKLLDCERELRAFLEETAALGGKREVLLVQLPPKLVYDTDSARSFFAELRRMYDGAVVLEPRHATWFSEAVDEWLVEIGVSRAAADPAPVAAAAAPAGSRALTYYRLHGSPHMYYSAYEGSALGEIARALLQAQQAWCIFDNTAAGSATINAMDVRDLVSPSALIDP